MVPGLQGLYNYCAKLWMRGSANTLISDLIVRFPFPVLKSAVESAYSVREIPQGLHLLPYRDLKHNTEYQIPWSPQRRNIGVCVLLFAIFMQSCYHHVPPPPRAQM